ncbi:MAG: lytic transglycosylase domain-containing protein [Acidimicrobiales bacterium]
MKPILALAMTLAAPSVAHAEMALLENGRILKVEARRIDGQTMFLELKGGGEVGIPGAGVRGFVPDEVVDEVLPLAAAGGDVRVLVGDAARRHGLDPALVLAVVSVESGFNPDAVSSKGAQGLMQLMPATAAALGVADALDPAANVDGGTRHLGALVARYGGDLKKALAAYNAGEGAVDQHGGIPPYAETRSYVARVLSRYRSSR